MTLKHQKTDKSDDPNVHQKPQSVSQKASKVEPKLVHKPEPVHMQKPVEKPEPSKRSENRQPDSRRDSSFPTKRDSLSVRRQEQPKSKQ